MTEHPDPEENFEGCIKSILRECVAEDAGVPEHMKDQYYLKQTAGHLIRLFELGAPQIMVSRACQKLAEKCTRFNENIPEESRWHEDETR